MPLRCFTDLLGITKPTSGDDCIKMLLDSPDVDPTVLVARIVALGFDFETAFGSGLRALHMATFFGRVEIVEAMLNHGVDIEAPSGAGMRAIHYAAKGRPGVLHVLLKRGATVNCADNKLFTPLHWACGEGNIDCVRALLDAGANIEAKDHQSATPLRRAAARGNIHVVRLLLERGADKRARVPSGLTMAQATGMPAVALLLL